MMSAEFEHYNDDDELWLSDLETRAMDLENELSGWRDARERALAGQEYAEERLRARRASRSAG